MRGGGPLLSLLREKEKRYDCTFCVIFHQKFITFDPLLLLFNLNLSYNLTNSRPPFHGILSKNNKTRQNWIYE